MRPAKKFASARDAFDLLDWVLLHYKGAALTRSVRNELEALHTRVSNQCYSEQIEKAAIDSELLGSVPVVLERVFPGPVWQSVLAARRQQAARKRRHDEQRTNPDSLGTIRVEANRMAGRHFKWLSAQLGVDRRQLLEEVAVWLRYDDQAGAALKRHLVARKVITQASVA